MSSSGRRESPMLKLKGEEMKSKIFQVKTQVKKEKGNLLVQLIGTGMSFMAANDYVNNLYGADEE